MSINLPETPILATLPELKAALRANCNVVLEAPPGAGKSTIVPLALLDEAWLGDGRIVVLQPRRIAARAVARRLAQIAAVDVGGLVGFRTRLESRVGRDTRIEVVTEGILTRRMQDDPGLEGVSCVIFDEFHERNLQSDLGLALALDLQRHLREELRLLVMSATLDALPLARLLGDAPTVRSIGRSYDVVTHHVDTVLPGGTAREVPIERRAVNAVVRALEQSPGDALVFLPGAGEIRRAVTMLAKAADPSLSILPLYGELDAAAQDAALRPDERGRRKVVFATNLAETSLTIEGVRIVVDAGLERRQRFDPNSGMSRLETRAISRASAGQRRGRAGRTAPGVCWRLWSESAHATLAAHAPPEIVEADLAPLALELACWGASDVDSLAWLDPPSPPRLAQARELLQRLEALDARGQVTAVGRSMARLGAHPRLAHMMLRAQPLGLGPLACSIAALLSERDPLRAVAPGMRDPDLRHRLDVLRGAAPPAGFTVDARALAQVRRSSEMLERRIRRDGSGREQRPALDADVATGLLLSFAYPDRIGVRRGTDSGRYLLANGRGAVLGGPAALARSEIVVAADLDAGEREARVHIAAPLDRRLLEEHFADRIVEHDEVCWDSRGAAVGARRTRRLDALILGEQPLRGRDAADTLPAMLEGIRELGLEALPWTEDLRQWRKRVALMRAQSANETERAEWPDVSDAALLATLESWLAPWLDGVSRREHLARIDLRAALHGLLDWSLHRRLDEATPTHVTVPSGSRIAVDYSTDAPTLSVRLQEIFGWKESPRVADGRVAITLELLSPARRPVQVTRDLASFWSRGYAEVRKELKGRYPKHYWPDDPYEAVATRRVRPPGA